MLYSHTIYVNFLIRGRNKVEAIRQKCVVKFIHTIDPCIDWRRVTLGMIAPSAHVTGDNCVCVMRGHRPLAPLADDAHYAAVVGGRGAQQFQGGHWRPRVGPVPKFDQASRNTRTHFTGVVVVDSTQFNYCTLKGFKSSFLHFIIA